MMKLFIAFEGADAVGKTTCAQALAEHLEEMGYSVLLTKDMGGNKFRNDIAKILLEKEIEDPLIEFLLISAIRKNNVNEILSSKYDIVITDRYTTSSDVYQGDLKGLSNDVLSYLNSLVTKQCEPDLNFLLDVDENEICRRIQASNTHTSFYDQKNIAVHKKIRNSFLKRAKSYKYTTGDWCIINANRPMSDVLDQVIGRTLKELA